MWFRSIRGTQIKLALAVDHVHAALYHINLQFLQMCEEAKQVLAAQQAAAPQPVLPPLVTEPAGSGVPAAATLPAVPEMPPLPDEALLPLRDPPMVLPLAEPPGVSLEVSSYQVLPPSTSAASVPVPQPRDPSQSAVPQDGPHSSWPPKAEGAPHAPEPVVFTAWVPPEVGKAPALDAGEFPPLPSANNKLHGKASLPEQATVLTRSSTPNSHGVETPQLPQRAQAVPVVARARKDAAPAPVPAILPKQATGPAQQQQQAPASEKGKKKDQASAGDAGIVPPGVAQPTLVLSRRDRAAGDSIFAVSQPEGMSSIDP